MGTSTNAKKHVLKFRSHSWEQQKHIRQKIDVIMEGSRQEHYHNYKALWCLQIISSSRGSIYAIGTINSAMYLNPEAIQ